MNIAIKKGGMIALKSKKSKAERYEIRTRRYEAFTKQLAKTLQTTAKQILWLYTINGILWIWCSYILAFMRRDQIAEALSSNVCTVVIGQMGFYIISKTVENIFQYNDIFAKRRMNLENTTSSTNANPVTDIPSPDTTASAATSNVIINNIVQEESNNESTESTNNGSVDPAALD